MAPRHARRLIASADRIPMHATLFYIIGASGVGKDSVLHDVRARLPETAPVLFAHRYITRPANAGGENHVALSQNEFDKRLHCGCFAMHWSSHGLCYGIGIEIREWLRQGMHVVVNGSRAYLDRAAALFPDLRPVLIQADPTILQQRLVARGRESAPEVGQRLQLAAERDAHVDHPRLTRIDNSGELRDAADRVIELLSEEQA